MENAWGGGQRISVARSSNGDAMAEWRREVTRVGGPRGDMQAARNEIGSGCGSRGRGQIIEFGEREAMSGPTKQVGFYQFGTGCGGRGRRVPGARIESRRRLRGDFGMEQYRGQPSGRVEFGRKGSV